MTILDRDTIVDRPEIVNRDDEDDESDKEEQSDSVDVLGNGGGETLHGLEFEQDDLDIIAGANTCAALATGQEDGEAFSQMFRNTAIQLKDMKSRNRDIDLLSYFGLNNGIGTIGLDQQKRDEVLTQVMDSSTDTSHPVGDTSESDQDSEDETEQQTDESEDEDSEIDDVEDEIDDMTDESGENAEGD